MTKRIRFTPRELELILRMVAIAECNMPFWGGSGDYAQWREKDGQAFTSLGTKAADLLRRREERKCEACQWLPCDCPRGWK